MSSFEAVLALVLMVVGFWFTRKTIVNFFTKRDSYNTGPQILGILLPAIVSIIIVPMLMIAIFGDNSDSKPSQISEPEAKKTTTITEAPAPSVRPEPETSEAVEYKLLSTDNFSFSGRKRIQFNISAPSANSYEQYAQTAIQAAKDFQRSQRVQVVYVFLGKNLEQINNGDALAIARYAVDGGGNSGEQSWYWQVEALKPLTDIEVKTLELWEKHGNKFAGENIFEPDIDGFKKFVAQELNTDISNVTMREPMRQAYIVE
ncbi:hypothetical protein GCM10007891_05610 [Methylophaga thalassica]|uniref:DUF4875 domain-containing protein n=1 Tax=Methylophaga thalassica TaxID=40223 RepID=A0ABQ5TT40_9GAMM|nr:DUF4875 domain-containing protein [Methylophaga thalassica]GLP98707.1 hypothetical protein GCM10007891_05610 [Methylophaga thalassica]